MAAEAAELERARRKAAALAVLTTSMATTSVSGSGGNSRDGSVSSTASTVVIGMSSASSAPGSASSSMSKHTGGGGGDADESPTAPYFVRRRERLSTDSDLARQAARTATATHAGVAQDDGADAVSIASSDGGDTDSSEPLPPMALGQGRRRAGVTLPSISRQTVLIPQTERQLRAAKLLHAGRVAEAADAGLLGMPVAVARSSASSASSNSKAWLARLAAGPTDAPWSGVSEGDLLLKLETLQDGSHDRSTVVGGSLRVLVEHLASEATPDSHYIECFLLTYRHIATADELMAELVARFNVVPPPDPTATELSYYAQWAPVIQMRTLSVLKKWLDLHPEDIRDSAGAQLAIHQLLHQPPTASTDVKGLIKRVQTALRDILAHAPSAASPAPPSVAPATAPSTPPMAARLDITTADPAELAQQLTLIDQEKFAAIQPVEFVRRLWVNASERTSHVSACIDWFNHLSFYVATQICKQADQKRRVKLIEAFILVAHECRKLRNLNTAMAIVAGLNNSAVRRLKRTWALVSAKSNELLYELDMLFADDGNFARYRELVAEIEHMPRLAPFIPFLGLLLHDLTFLNDGNPSTICPGVFNFAKLRRIAEPILFARTLGQIKYSFAETRHSAALRASLQRSR